MVVLRGTRKLLTRLQTRPEAEPGRSTTMLGDWYADILFTDRQNVLLCISEHARLPIVISARDLGTFPSRLAAALAAVLTELSIPRPLVERELDGMTTAQFATTASRSLLGTMNDYAIAVTWALAEEPGLSLHRLSVRLADTPVGPMQGARAVDVAYGRLVAT